MKVIEALRVNPLGKELADRLERDVRSEAQNKLDHFRDLFPHFTDHALRHSEGVIAILDWLIPDEIKEKLNEWELYFLLAAAYLHDIGMVEQCPGPPSGPEWEQFLTEYQENEHLAGTDVARRAKQDFIRDHHHVRSERYITDHWRDLGLRASDTPAEGAIVGRIALGHRKVDLSDRTQFAEIPFGQNQLIRRDLLAAYLRLADELDTTAHRTPWAEYEVVTLYDETSVTEWAKHLAISGVAVEQGVIVIGGRCHDHGVYLRLNRLERDIKAKLTTLRGMLRRPYETGDGVRFADPLPYHDVKLNVEHVGYLPIEIQFELQDEQITKLIMGERLYGDKTACIRELLQNAIDTCREARELRPASWKPKIEVAESNDGRVLEVLDNGMGMDEYIVREYFSKVGFSYYQSADFEGDFRPISEFGIGVLSSFMLADRIEVETKKADADAVHLEIASLTEPFVPSPGTRIEPGTTVRLHLKAKEVGKHDVLERVRYFARHLEFVVDVTTRHGQSEVVVDRGLAPTADDLKQIVYNPRETLSYPHDWSPERISELLVDRKRHGIQLGITPLTSLIPYNLDGMGDYENRLIGGSRVCQNGFPVDSFHEAFSEFASHCWCELNLSGEHRINLTADRTRAAGDAAEVWKEVAELYSDIIEDMCEKSGDLTPSAWWQHHISYYPARLKRLPRSLSAAARKHARFCTLTSEGFRDRSLTELAKWDGVIFYVEPQHHHYLKHIQHGIEKSSCILILPRRSFGPISEYWEMVLLGRADLQPLSSRLREVGVAVKKVRIDRNERRFLDLGAFTGEWRIAWTWTTPTSPPQTFFDLHHPFSSILLKNCRRELPTTSSRALAELFRLAHTYSQQEVLERQSEVLKLLNDDGIKVPVDIDPMSNSAGGIKNHNCPYVSIRSWPL